MAEAARHRGPDGMSYWTGEAVGLAHLARWFTPESRHEQQPLSAKRNQWVLVADARIDNREDLIAALGKPETASNEGAQASFPLTDAELVLAAYEQWGPDCVTHLIGDFAFAIWDGQLRRLFAARDAMAMRAFYYRIEPRRLLFASEVSQLLADPSVPARIFEPALGAWLANIDYPLDWTFYEGIQQLPPGHTLLADAFGHKVKKFWDVDPDHRVTYRNDAEYTEQFQELFEQAVACRLRSIAPIGISLSGGMDSGSVASMAGLLCERYPANGCAPIHAYCYAYDGYPECDERHISDLVARRYGMQVTPVPSDRASPLKDYPTDGPHRDGPSVGPYQAMVELGLKMAHSDGMRGMLYGTHGDHMVGGSTFEYPEMLLSGRWISLGRDLLEHGKYRPQPIATAAWHHLIVPLMQEARLGAVRRTARRWMGGAAERPAWIRPDFARRVGLDEGPRRCIPQARLRGISRRKRYQGMFAPYERNNVVVLERMCAQFGLERLDPWGDRRIAEFVLAVPQRVICRAGERKRLARSAMRGVMPETARRGARKFYPVPLYQHTTRVQERAIVLELLTNSQCAARGYLDGRLLKHHFETSDSDEESDAFWPALAAEMWLRSYWA
ncbi:MAG: hypothetical protein GY798_07770 [Hyphomicrobiales bacterium]|nr:hypothetical protein [Hyphomicrobiales bacterium]